MVPRLVFASDDPAAERLESKEYAKKETSSRDRQPVLEEIFDRTAQMFSHQELRFLSLEAITSPEHSLNHRKYE